METESSVPVKCIFNSKMNTLELIRGTDVFLERNKADYKLLNIINMLLNIIIETTPWLSPVAALSSLAGQVLAHVML